MKILITGAKSALALKFLKAFDNSTIIFADYGDVPTFFSANYRFISLGERNDETLAHTLLSRCLDENIDTILPLHFFEVEPIVRAEILFREFNVHVLLPPIGQLNNYVKNVALQKSDWVVFVNGKIAYTSQANELISYYGETKQLNGVYYYEVSSEGIRLLLMTI